MNKETDVKNIEWLKKEIHKELEDWHGVEGGIDGDGINEIMLLINQLDEPEVEQLERKIKELESFNDFLIRGNNRLRNELDKLEVLSQEWIAEHSNGLSRSQYVWVDDLKELFVPTLSETETDEITEEQVMEWLDNNDFYCHATAETVLANAVDKGELGYYGTKYSVVEKPTIPKFVAEAIERDKEDGYDVYDSIDLIIETNGGGLPSLSDWVAINIDKYARAWLNGYMVEKEHRYYVSARAEEHSGFWFLSKNNNGDISVGTNKDYFEADWDTLKLTEQEIKDYDERYWAFRKPVEELEE